LLFNAQMQCHVRHVDKGEITEANTLY
jgi:hypothetical protein